MSDAADYAAAFAELTRLVQPDVDPVLSYGNGLEPDVDAELDAVLVKAKVAATWTAATAYRYGDKVVPTTPKGRLYQCVEPGTSGPTEPTFPEYDGGKVADGTVTWEEVGLFGGSVYDLRRAAYLAWDLKVAKATNKDQYLADARGQASSFLYLNCVRERDKYRPVGIA